MLTAAQPSTALDAGFRRLKFTPEEYWFLHEQGMLPKFSELIDGEIYEMPAQHWPAMAAIEAIKDPLKALWHDRRLVGSNVTHVFASGWQPMPDVVVYDALPPRRPGKNVAWPMPRLIVEVSDETLAYDLGEKARRYAAEGVPELWVGDVNGRALHVHREPAGDDWRVRHVHAVGDVVAPLCLPDARLAVADLLPDLYGQVVPAVPA